MRPEVDRCVECDRVLEADERFRWVPPLGGVLCERCPGPPRGRAGLSLEALKLLKAYQRLDVEALAALRLPAAGRARGRGRRCATSSATRSSARRARSRFLDEVRVGPDPGTPVGAPRAATTPAASPLSAGPPGRRAVAAPGVASCELLVLPSVGEAGGRPSRPHSPASHRRLRDPLATPRRGPDRGPHSPRSAAATGHGTRPCASMPVIGCAARTAGRRCRARRDGRDDGDGHRALERLERERIGWLTTVTPDGQPQTLPIWFVWEAGTILVYGKKVAVRNRNLRLNPRVSFHLADREGDDIVEIEGEAALDPDAPPSKDHPAYAAKYAELPRSLRLDARVPQRGVPAPVPHRADRRPRLLMTGGRRCDAAGRSWSAPRRALVPLAGVVAARAGGRRLVARTDRRANTPTRPPPYRGVRGRPSSCTATLLVADLHADSLLWGRDLLARGDRGHVDVPAPHRGRRRAPGALGLGARAAPPATSSATPTPRTTCCSWRSPAAGRPGPGAARGRGRSTSPSGRGGWPTHPRAVHARRVRAPTSSAYLARRVGGPGHHRRLPDDRGRLAARGRPGRHSIVLADAGYRMLGLAHFVDNAFAGSAHGVDEGRPDRRSDASSCARAEARSVLIDRRPRVGGDRRRRARGRDAGRSSCSHGGLRSVARRRSATCPTSRCAASPRPAASSASGSGRTVRRRRRRGRRSRRAIVRAIEVAGVEHVALGSDFDGAVPVPFDVTGLPQLTEALHGGGAGARRDRGGHGRQRGPAARRGRCPTPDVRQSRGGAVRRSASIRAPTEPRSSLPRSAAKRSALPVTDQPSPGRPPRTPTRGRAGRPRPRHDRLAVASGAASSSRARRSTAASTPCGTTGRSASS